MNIEECLNKLLDAQKKVSFESICGHLDKMEDIELKNRWRKILEEFKSK